MKYFAFIVLALVASTQAWSLGSLFSKNTLVVYALSKENMENADRFFSNIDEQADVVVVADSSEAEDYVESFSNVKELFVARDAGSCFAMRAFREVAAAKQGDYTNYIFVDSLAQGPFTSDWTSSFTSKLSGNVKLVGPAVHCGSVKYVTGAAWGTDNEGLDIILKADAFTCSGEEAHLQGSRMSVAIQAAGKSISGLHALQAAEYIDNGLGCAEDPLSNGVLGLPMSPAEVVFVARAGGRRSLATRYHKNFDYYQIAYDYYNDCVLEFDVHIPETNMTAPSPAPMAGPSPAPMAGPSPSPTPMAGPSPSPTPMAAPAPAPTPVRRAHLPSGPMAAMLWATHDNLLAKFRTYVDNSDLDNKEWVKQYADIRHTGNGTWHATVFLFDSEDECAEEVNKFALEVSTLLSAQGFHAMNFKAGGNTFTPTAATTTSSTTSTTGAATAAAATTGEEDDDGLAGGVVALIVIVIIIIIIAIGVAGWMMMSKKTDDPSAVTKPRKGAGYGRGAGQGESEEEEDESDEDESDDYDDE